MFNNGRNKVGDGLFDLGRRKLMREYDDIEDELFEDFKKRSKPTAHSELSNPPPPTPMLNSGRIFSQQSVNTSTNRLPQFSTSQRLPSNGARHSSSFGSLSNHAKSTVELNTRPSLSHRLVSSFHNENDQTSYMNPSQPIHDETPKEQKYSHLPAFSSSMMQQASQLPKSKSLTKICNNQQQEWLREKPLDFLIENQRETNDNQFNGTKESNEYEDDILKLVQGCYDEPNVNTSPTKEIENIHQQENSEKFRKTNEKKIKSKKKKKNKNKESPFKIENEYSPSQPTLEEDDAQNRRKDHHQQHHAEHQQEVSLRWSKSDKQHSRQKESRPLPPSDRALIRRHQYCAKSIYVDSYVTRIVDNDLLLDDCTDFESSSRRKSSCTDALFSQDLRLLIDEQEVPPFVLSSKTFRLVGLSSNAIFMWTLICSMKYDRLRKNNDQRQRGSYERSLLKQFRKQADYRVIYSGEANDYKSSAPPNTRQLDNFLNSEYHSLIGIKSKQFNDYIPRDIHKYYPLSKRVVNLLMSLPSSLDIEKIGRNDRESSQSNDRSSKSSRYGIPLIDKNKRRQLASRDDSKSISSLTNCIEIDDDEDDSNSKSSYDRSRRNKNDKRAYSDKYKNKSNSPSSTSKRSPKNNSNFSLSNEEKRISEEKSANERIAELRKMLPMIGKKPKKPIKSVKSLLEMTRSKNSVPHKPGPYQPMKVTPSLVPAGKSAQLSTLSSDQNMEMQISDESEHNEDAQPKSEDTIPSQPPLPPPVNEVKDELPPLPPTPPIDSKKLPNPLADPVFVPKIQVDKIDTKVSHSNIVKQQLVAMEAFLNRGKAKEITPSLTAVPETSTPAVQEAQPYSYAYPVDTTYDANAANTAAMYPAYASQTNDYWNSYYSQPGQPAMINQSAVNFSVPPPTLAFDNAPPTIVNTQLLPPSLDVVGVMPANINTCIPPPPPPPALEPEFNEPTQTTEMDLSEEAEETSHDPADMNVTIVDEDDYDLDDDLDDGLANEPLDVDQSLESIADVEWYECKYVETSEYTGIEPPIPGMQREILPAIPGVKSTYSLTDTPIDIAEDNVSTINAVPSDHVPNNANQCEIVHNDESLVDDEFRGSMPVVDWTEKIRMFVYRTEQSICFDAEKVLFEMGIHNLYPEDIQNLPEDCQYQIFIHKSHVKDIENIPNLYNLKCDPRVYFMCFNELQEVQNYSSSPLLPSGGQVIIDDPGLVLTTAERLSKMLEFMECQVNLGCQWSLKVHKDCLKVLEMKSSEDGNCREAAVYTLLTSPRFATSDPETSIVEIMCVGHETRCTRQPVTTEEYRECLRSLQISNVQRFRETYLFTDSKLHNDDNGEFSKYGIKMTTIEEFVKNIEQS